MNNETKTIPINELGAFLGSNLKVRTDTGYIAEMVIRGESNQEVGINIILINPEYKPLVRPMSQLTESEIDSIKLLYDVEIRNGSISMHIDGSWTNYPTDLPFDLVQVLVKLHLDIFGWIDKGLAEELT
jgi:LEA14-like dessication related protein